MNDLERFKLEHTIRFTRSVVLASAFLYIFISIIRIIAQDGICVELQSLRIGIVIFILSIYSITYTDMFKQHHELLLSIYVIANSITLAAMGVMSQGVESITTMPLSLLPSATIVLVLNYVVLMRFNVAIVSGFIVSMPYMLVSIYAGTTNLIITTFMIVITLNILLSFNLYSHNAMLTSIWKANTSKE